MIRTLLDLYSLLLIADFIISFFPSIKYQPWVRNIRKASEFTCKPVRQILPPDLPIDPSPFIVILAINLLKLLW
jgi:uncharacterized protein YggT (Ycf19 family)